MQNTSDYSLKTFYENIVLIHSGVKKYYEELGIISYNDNIKCKNFVGTTGKCKLDLINS